jgi:hypothetical protein
MSEIIQLTDTLRLRRANSLNVVVETLVNDEKGEGDKWRDYNGSGRGPYCANEADACVWVLKHGLVDEGGETDLQEAVKRYEKAAKSLSRAVAKALESM